jgi:hypothetical protein
MGALFQQKPSVRRKMICYFYSSDFGTTALTPIVPDATILTLVALAWPA